MATSKKKSSGDPCWEGYEQVGMKMKNGKLVPDCVPIKKNNKAATKKTATKKAAGKKAATKKSSGKKAGTKKAATKKAAAKK